MAISADLSQLGRELKEVNKGFATAVRKAVRTAVKDAGQEILQEIKSEASWSKRIPRATRITASFGAKSAGIKIVTSARTAPHGRPYEHNGSGGSFRHPVFGTDKGVWVTQPARPFFFAAVRKKDAATNAKFEAAIRRAIRESGFH